MVYLLPMKLFVFTTTFKLFGAKICFAKIQQASLNWPFSGDEQIELENVANTLLEMNKLN